MILPTSGLMILNLSYSSRLLQENKLNPQTGLLINISQGIGRMRDCLIWHCYCLFCHRLHFHWISQKRSKIIFPFPVLQNSKNYRKNVSQIVYLFIYIFLVSIHSFPHPMRWYYSRDHIRSVEEFDYSMIDRSQVRWQIQYSVAQSRQKYWKLKDFYRQFTHFLLYFFTNHWHKIEITQTPIMC